MRIISRPEFLGMPSGTVFATYQPCTFGPLQLKGKTVGRDFYSADLVGAVAWGTSGDFFERCAAMEAGDSFPAFFENWGRDAQFAPDTQRYAIYEPADIERLVATITKTPGLGQWNGTYTYQLKSLQTGEVTITDSNAYDLTQKQRGLVQPCGRSVRILWAGGYAWDITLEDQEQLSLSTPYGPGRIGKI